MGGGDKPLLDLDGKPIIAHVIDRLDATTGSIAINANADAARFEGLGLPVIPDATMTFDGPLAGILAGLDWTQANGFDRLLTIAADTPFFPRSLAQRLLTVSNEHTIAVAASGGRLHPTFAIWPVSLRADLETMLAQGMRRVVDFLARHPSIAVDFPAVDIDGSPIDPFFNINWPEDLAEARRIAAKLGA